MNPVRTIALRRLSSPLLVSLAVHAAILIAWMVLAMQQAAHWQKRKASPLTWIEIQDAPKSKSQDSVREAAERKRVVQTQLQTPATVAPKDALLGQQNQKVDRQTVTESSHASTGSAANPRVQATAVPAKPQSPRASASRTTAIPLSHLGALHVQQLQKRDLAPTPTWAPQLNPRESAPQEYLSGYEKGQTTALNTREYVFFGYFQRIRQRLDLAWTRQLRTQLERYYRRGRTLASEMDYTTRTLVTLNDQGAIIKVQVLEESGAVDLDQAAIEAFNRAGPFPNPPRGVVDARGLIEIRWDFVVRN